MKPASVRWSLLACLCAVAVGLAAEDYYKLLRLPKDASKGQIKEAARKLKKEYHPDRNREPGADAKFIAINEAEQVLENDETRRIYDKFGEAGLKQHREGGGGGGEYHEPFNIFDHFFNGGRAEPKKPEIHLDLDVDLRELYMGEMIDVSVSKTVVCDHCGGTGAKDTHDIKQCGGCGGRGMKTGRHMLGPGIYQAVQTQCDECGGKGKIVTTVCRACDGREVRRGSDQLTVVVGKGMRDGQKIEFPAESDDFTGDVIFTVRQQAHPIFVRREDNLYTKETITLREALTGFERTITHLDGEKITLRRMNVTQPGFVQVLMGKGMPVHEKPSVKGRLFVEYNVVFPASLTPEANKAFKELLP